jgi:hypothetical protein
MDLSHSVAYHLYKACNPPGAVVAIDVSDDMVNNNLAGVGQVIAKHDAYSLFAKYGVNLVYRQSDTIRVAEANLLPPFSIYLTTALRVIGYLVANPIAMAKVCKHGSLIGIQLIFNCNHRAQNEGHNGFTDKINTPGTQQNRLLAVAGARADEFKAANSLNNAIHDYHHALTDATLW